MVTGRLIDRASAGFMALALVLGGAGSGYPLVGAVLELAAIALLVVVLAGSARPALPAAARWPLAFVALVVALPLIQLIPLPPSWWTGLPGRELAARATTLAGFDDIWRPLSLTPDATRRALLALLPPIAMLVAVLHLSIAARMMMLRVVVVAGVVGVVIGALQLASGNGAGVTVFATAHQGYAVGLFVNRNHQASFLLLAMIAAAVPGVVARRGGMMVPALVLLFALGVVATISRAGLLLLPIAGAFAMALWIGRVPRGRVVLLGVAAMLIGAAVLAGTTLGSRTLTRFAVAASDSRFDFWTNGWWLAGTMLPWGGGLGSFTALYGISEPLGQVARFYVNHAHNDALQLLIEAGWPGVVVMVALVVLVVAGARHVRAPVDPVTAMPLAGLGMIVVLGLHALADYPLRMVAPAVLFALAGGLMTPPPAASGGRRRRPVPLVALAAGAMVAAWQVTAAGVSMHLLDRDPAGAAQVAPWLTPPLVRLAESALIAGRRADAAEAAQMALAIAPLQVAALSTLALSVDDPAALMDVAARLGWRDRLVQLWLVQRGLETGDMTLAAQRIDALLRQKGLAEPVLALADRQLADPRFRVAFAERLAERPLWRQAFLAHVPLDPAAKVALFEELARGPAAPGVAEAQPLIEARWMAGDGDAAWRLWTLAGRGRQSVDDGGFEGGGAGALVPSGPFGWRAPPLVGVRVTRGVPGGTWRGQALRLASDGLAGGDAVEQVLALAPGRYRLDYVSRGTVDGQWRLWCGAYALPVSVAAAGPGREGRVRDLVFAVPQGCDWQRLALEIAATPGELWIDAVSIDRLR